MKPSVYLIGAGPGDPGLITVHGLECLRRADVVIYDHLVSPRLLRHAKHTSELIDVGTAAPQAMEQEAISYLLAEKAREGKMVARLKWGDPFVFDRGGEEALFLQQQGIVFEVVPGIPAGIAVPAYAGVPVTYPGGGDTITLVRGFEDESRTPPKIDWAGLVRLEGTVVCYAGAQQLPLILESLQEHGWPSDGQAVAVYNGTLPAQQTLTGTLAELLEQTREKRGREAAILIVGRVAGLREHLRWYDTRPLFGTRVLVTRAREQATELADLLSRPRRRPGGGADDPHPAAGGPGAAAARRQHREHLRLGGLHQRQRGGCPDEGGGRNRRRRPVVEGADALRRRQRHRRAAGALRHQGGPGAQRVPGRGAGRGPGRAGIARRGPGAVAARRHRPRGRGRQPARRWRAW